jgi:hypothetical protein
MKKWIYLLLLLAAFQFNLVVEGATTNVVNLKCEYRENPIGTGVQKPMLIWQIESAEKGWMQSAYEIKVASSESLINEDKGDIWESGKVSSSESVNILYEGGKLISNTRYYWKVRVWDLRGKPSSWSKPAFWHTGIFDVSEWHAKWISSRYVEAKQGHLQIPERADPWIFLPATPDTAAMLLRKKTEVAKQPVKATYKSIRGDITTSWKQDKDTYTIKVNIPANTRATVFLPATDIKRISESGKPLVNNEYFGPIKTENGKTIVDIGSGSYSFTINQQ